MESAPRWPRARVYALNRMVTLIVVGLTLGSLGWQPRPGWESLIDWALRSYGLFLAAVMAHEATHHHLARSARANRWWGRLAMLPVMVPALAFRKTHGLHHAHTNEAGHDPDHFLKPAAAWEIPLRSLMLPYHWLIWLVRSGRWHGADTREAALSYAAYGLIYGGLAAWVGPARVAWGMGPAVLTLSLVLWYVFGVKTHEGYATGEAAWRSHDYYGRWLFWATCGLSMHRTHHMRPGLAWIEMRPHVRAAPLDGRRRLMRRDIARS